MRYAQGTGIGPCWHVVSETLEDTAASSLRCLFAASALVHSQRLHADAHASMSVLCYSGTSCLQADLCSVAQLGVGTVNGRGLL
jgi:hypothetical protein